MHNRHQRDEIAAQVAEIKTGGVDIIRNVSADIVPELKARLPELRGRLLANQPLGEFTPLQLLYNNFAVVVGLVYVHLPFMVLPLYAALCRLAYREADWDGTWWMTRPDTTGPYYKTGQSIMVRTDESGL